MIASRSCLGGDLDNTPWASGHWGRPPRRFLGFSELETAFGFMGVGDRAEALVTGIAENVLREFI